MKLKEWDAWIHSHAELFIDLIRIYLGIGLLVKGIFFLAHPSQLIVPPDIGSLAQVAWVIPYVHIAGGFLLALGVLVRLAAAAQIPILFAAVFMVHMPRIASIQSRESLEFSGLVLFLLALIFIKGSGRLSLPEYMSGKRPARSSHPVQKWVDDHPDFFLDAIRAYLGVGLFIKGVYIMQHRDQFLQLLDQSGNTSLLMLTAAHYVIPAHFAGGALLAFGVVTRAAALAQLPPLIGAIFYIFLPRFATLEMRESFEFTSLVLFLILLIAAYGPGKFSVDHLLQKSQPVEPELQPAN